MKINIRLDIEVDTDTWADQYNFDRAEMERFGTYVLAVKEHALRTLTADVLSGLESHEGAGRVTDVAAVSN